MSKRIRRLVTRHTLFVTERGFTLIELAMVLVVIGVVVKRLIS